MTTPRLVHLALRADWAAAAGTGRYGVSTRGLTVAEAGFLHAATAGQLGGVLARYYGDLDPAGLVVLVLDVAALDAAGRPVRWDPAPGTGELFPHVLGDLPVGAVTAVLPLTGTREAPQLPDLAGHDVLEAPPPHA